MRNAHLCTAETLYRETLEKAEKKTEKMYLFLDEIPEVANMGKNV